MVLMGKKSKKQKSPPKEVAKLTRKTSDNSDDSDVIGEDDGKPSESVTKKAPETVEPISKVVAQPPKKRKESDDSSDDDDELKKPEAKQVSKVVSQPPKKTKDSDDSSDDDDELKKPDAKQVSKVVAHPPKKTKDSDDSSDDDDSPSKPIAKQLPKEATQPPKKTTDSDDSSDDDDAPSKPIAKQVPKEATQPPKKTKDSDASSDDDDTSIKSIAKQVPKEATESSIKSSGKTNSDTDDKPLKPVPQVVAEPPISVAKERQTIEEAESKSSVKKSQKELVESSPIKMPNSLPKISRSESLSAPVLPDSLPIVPKSVTKQTNKNLAADPEIEIWQTNNSKQCQTDITLNPEGFPPNMETDIQTMCTIEPKIDCSDSRITEKLRTQYEHKEILIENSRRQEELGEKKKILEDDEENEVELEGKERKLIPSSVVRKSKTPDSLSTITKFNEPIFRPITKPDNVMNDTDTDIDKRLLNDISDTMKALLVEVSNLKTLYGQESKEQDQNEFSNYIPTADETIEQISEFDKYEYDLLTQDADEFPLAVVITNSAVVKYDDIKFDLPARNIKDFDNLLIDPEELSISRPMMDTDLLEPPARLDSNIFTVGSKLPWEMDPLAVKPMWDRNLSTGIIPPQVGLIKRRDRTIFLEDYIQYIMQDKDLLVKPYLDKPEEKPKSEPNQNEIKYRLQYDTDLGRSPPRLRKDIQDKLVQCKCGISEEIGECICGCPENRYICEMNQIQDDDNLSSASIESDLTVPRGMFDYDLHGKFIRKTNKRNLNDVMWDYNLDPNSSRYHLANRVDNRESTESLENAYNETYMERGMFDFDLIDKTSVDPKVYLNKRAMFDFDLGELSDDSSTFDTQSLNTPMMDYNLKCDSFKPQFGQMSNLYIKHVHKGKRAMFDVDLKATNEMDPRLSFSEESGDSSPKPMWEYDIGKKIVPEKRKRRRLSQKKYSSSEEDGYANNVVSIQKKRNTTIYDDGKRILTAKKEKKQNETQTSDLINTIDERAQVSTNTKIEYTTTEENEENTTTPANENKEMHESQSKDEFMDALSTEQPEISNERADVLKTDKELSNRVAKSSYHQSTNGLQEKLLDVTPRDVQLIENQAAFNKRESLSHKKIPQSISEILPIDNKTQIIEISSPSVHDKVTDTWSLNKQTDAQMIKNQGGLNKRESISYQKNPQSINEILPIDNKVQIIETSSPSTQDKVTDVWSLNKESDAQLIQNQDGPNKRGSMSYQKTPQSISEILTIENEVQIIATSLSTHDKVTDTWSLNKKKDAHSIQNQDIINKRESLDNKKKPQSISEILPIENKLQISERSPSTHDKLTDTWSLNKETDAQSIQNQDDFNKRESMSYQKTTQSNNEILAIDNKVQIIRRSPSTHDKVTDTWSLNKETNEQSIKNQDTLNKRESLSNKKSPQLVSEILPIDNKEQIIETSPSTHDKVTDTWSLNTEKGAHSIQNQNTLNEREGLSHTKTLESSKIWPIINEVQTSLGTYDKVTDTQSLNKETDTRSLNKEINAQSIQNQDDLNKRESMSYQKTLQSINGSVTTDNKVEIIKTSPSTYDKVTDTCSLNKETNAQSIKNQDSLDKRENLSSTMNEPDQKSLNTNKVSDDIDSNKSSITKSLRSSKYSLKKRENITIVKPSGRGPCKACMHEAQIQSINLDEISDLFGVTPEKDKTLTTSGKMGNLSPTTILPKTENEKSICEYEMEDRNELNKNNSSVCTCDTENLKNIKAKPILRIILPYTNSSKKKNILEIAFTQTSSQFSNSSLEQRQAGGENFKTENKFKNEKNYWSSEIVQPGNIPEKNSSEIVDHELTEGWSVTACQQHYKGCSSHASVTHILHEGQYNCDKMSYDDKIQQIEKIITKYTHQYGLSFDCIYHKKKMRETFKQWLDSTNDLSSNRSSSRILAERRKFMQEVKAKSEIIAFLDYEVLSDTPDNNDSFMRYENELRELEYYSNQYDNFANNQLGCTCNAQILSSLNECCSMSINSSISKLNKYYSNEDKNLDDNQLYCMCNAKIISNECCFTPIKSISNLSNSECDLNQLNNVCECCFKQTNPEISNSECKANILKDVCECCIKPLKIANSKTNNSDHKANISRTKCRANISQHKRNASECKAKSITKKSFNAGRNLCSCSKPRTTNINKLSEMNSFTCQISVATIPSLRPVKETEFDNVNKSEIIEHSNITDVISNLSSTPTMSEQNQSFTNTIDNESYFKTPWNCDYSHLELDCDEQVPVKISSATLVTQPINTFKEKHDESEFKISWSSDYSHFSKDDCASVQNKTNQSEILLNFEHLEKVKKDRWVISTHKIAASGLLLNNKSPSCPTISQINSSFNESINDPMRQTWSEDYSQFIEESDCMSLQSKAQYSEPLLNLRCINDMVPVCSAKVAAMETFNYLISASGINLKIASSKPKEGIINDVSSKTALNIFYSCSSIPNDTDWTLKIQRSATRSEYRSCEKFDQLIKAKSSTDYSYKNCFDYQIHEQPCKCSTCRLKDQSVNRSINSPFCRCKMCKVSDCKCAAVQVKSFTKSYGDVCKCEICNCEAVNSFSNPKIFQQSIKNSVSSLIECELKNLQLGTSTEQYYKHICGICKLENCECDMKIKHKTSNNLERKSLQISKCESLILHHPNCKCEVCQYKTPILQLASKSQETSKFESFNCDKANFQSSKKLNVNTISQEKCKCEISELNDCKCENSYQQFKSDHLQSNQQTQLLPTMESNDNVMHYPYCKCEICTEDSCECKTSKLQSIIRSTTKSNTSKNQSSKYEVFKEDICECVISRSHSTIKSNIDQNPNYKAEIPEDMDICECQVAKMLSTIKDSTNQYPSYKQEVDKKVYGKRENLNQSSITKPNEYFTNQQSCKCNACEEVNCKCETSKRYYQTKQINDIQMSHKSLKCRICKEVNCKCETVKLQSEKEFISLISQQQVSEIIGNENLKSTKECVHAKSKNPNLQLSTKFDNNQPDHQIGTRTDCECKTSISVPSIKSVRLLLDEEVCLCAFCKCEPLVPYSKDHSSSRLPYENDCLCCKSETLIPDSSSKSKNKSFNTLEDEQICLCSVCHCENINENLQSRLKSGKSEPQILSNKVYQCEKFSPILHQQSFVCRAHKNSGISQSSRKSNENLRTETKYINSKYIVCQCGRQIKTENLNSRKSNSSMCQQTCKCELIVCNCKSGNKLSNMISYRLPSDQQMSFRSDKSKDNSVHQQKYKCEVCKLVNCKCETLSQQNCTCSICRCGKTNSHSISKLNEHQERCNCNVCQIIGCVCQTDNLQPIPSISSRETCECIKHKMKITVENSKETCECIKRKKKLIDENSGEICECVKRQKTNDIESIKLSELKVHPNHSESINCKNIKPHFSIRNDISKDSEISKCECITKKSEPNKYQKHQEANEVSIKFQRKGSFSKCFTESESVLKVCNLSSCYSRHSVRATKQGIKTICSARSKKRKNSKLNKRRKSQDNNKSSERNISSKTTSTTSTASQTERKILRDNVVTNTIISYENEIRPLKEALSSLHAKIKNLNFIDVGPLSTNLNTKYYPIDTTAFPNLYQTPTHPIRECFCPENPIELQNLNCRTNLPNQDWTKSRTMPPYSSNTNYDYLAPKPFQANLCGTSKDVDNIAFVRQSPRKPDNSSPIKQHRQIKAEAIPISPKIKSMKPFNEVYSRKHMSQNLPNLKIEPENFILGSTPLRTDPDLLFSWKKSTNKYDK